jgi:hypothetical protein
MSNQAISLLTLNIIASVAVPQHVAVTAAGVPSATNLYGVTTMAAAAGQSVPVDVIGTTPITAGAAIPVGTQFVIADANGCAIAGGTAGACLGRLVPGQYASAAGDIVEVLLQLDI